MIVHSNVSTKVTVDSSYLESPLLHSFPMNPAMYEQPTGSGTQNDFPIQLPLVAHEMEQKAPQLFSPQASE